MVDSLVSPLIKAMIPKVSSYIRSQYTWQKDMKDDLTKLEATLLDIQIEVAEAERGQIMDQKQYEVLRHLKDAVYEADDVLDEFEYQDMLVRAKEARDPVSCIASFFFRFAKRLIGQDELRNQLREVLEKLKENNPRAKRLTDVLRSKGTIPSEQVDVDPSRVTSSIISEARIFGRDREKAEIVSLLLRQSADEPESSDSKPFHVIPIVGIGGVGKTTLAQLVYNDTGIASNEHFKLHLWVSVSNRFDLFRLTRDMLVSMSQNGEEHQDFKNLDFDSLQKKLQTKLKSKRFLLVLDDVWMDEKLSHYENEEMWKKLLAPLKDGAKGSKILVTTRMKNVAKMFNEENLIFLEGLEKDKYLQLFTSCAFGNKNPDDYPELKEIANKIVIKLKGSPLAAKAVGSLLREKLDHKEWNDILQARELDDIMKTLGLSYKYLPDHLKLCFAYCSVFPKDWKFNLQNLALLWMAQGYVQCENVGIDYFNQLVSRSFFQIVEEDSSKSYYVMHNLIHDLAEHVSIDECFRIDGGEQRSIGPSIRHIGVFLNYDSYYTDEHVWSQLEKTQEDVWSQLEKMSNRKNLRTLLLIAWGTTTLPSWFKEVRSLRVLGFGCSFEGDIGHLVHLRYLELGYDDNFSAESLSRLFHLEVVVLGSGWLRYSKSLTELSASGKLTHILGRLEFVVGKRRGVRDLKDIKLLRRGELSIENVENVRSEVEAAEVGLEHHQFIKNLSLWWGDSETRIGRHDSEEKVVDALKPHPNLQQLRIENFGGRRCPSWLETNWLIHLQSIELYDCKGLKVMPPLGHLPFLKDLFLRGMDSVERIGREFYGHGNHEVKGFPSLEVLFFYYIPAWVEWSAAEFPVFPLLRKLTLWKCPKLKRFPSFPRAVEEPVTARGMSPLVALQELLIDNCTEELLASMIPDDDDEEEGRGILSPSLASLQILSCGVTDRYLSRCLQGLPSLSYLKIQGCNGLTSLPSTEVLHRLTALQEMFILNCKELVSFGGLHALPYLQKLYVTNCPKLVSLPEEGLPLSIKDVKLQGCHPALEKQMHKKEGPVWDKISRIPSLQLLGSSS